MVWALDVRLEVAGSIPADALSSATLGKPLTQCTSVSEQCNLAGEAG